MNKAKKSRIPEFKSIQEEAEWWDSHSLADYQDEFKTVGFHFAKKPSHEIKITFESKEMKKLDEKASKKKTNVVSLAKELILEHL